MRIIVWNPTDVACLSQTNSHSKPSISLLLLPFISGGSTNAGRPSWAQSHVTPNPDNLVLESPKALPHEILCKTKAMLANCSRLHREWIRQQTHTRSRYIRKVNYASGCAKLLQIHLQTLIPFQLVRVWWEQSVFFAEKEAEAIRQGSVF